MFLVRVIITHPDYKRPYVELYHKFFKTEQEAQIYTDIQFYTFLLEIDFTLCHKCESATIDNIYNCINCGKMRKTLSNSNFLKKLINKDNDAHELLKNAIEQYEDSGIHYDNSYMEMSPIQVLIEKIPKL